MKKILGLDLGTTSIGWAMVNQAESTEERSSIIKIGVRVNPLTADEKDSFEKGKAITSNSNRTQKRGMRRNLQRYRLRRDCLIATLKREGWINDDTILSEDGPGTTYETLELRSRAASEEIPLRDLARVLLNINKKRGYKSSRKVSGDEDGHLVNGMEVAKALYEQGLTPGQFSLRLLSNGKKILPDYYRSDLNKEYERIWSFQKQFYPDILSDDFHKQLDYQGQANVTKIFLGKYGIYSADNKGKDRRATALSWRVEALKERVEKDVLAYVIANLRGEISNSSGYLGSISDRSKELWFNHLTVGQYLYGKILSEPGWSTRNQVFYRQDYMDEFETIWECQKAFHPEMTETLKKELRDVIIFYQRPLKSQKGLVSFCEFESHEVKVTTDGKEKVKKRGCRVAPRSSLLFQEFKIWQNLNNLQICDSVSGEHFSLSVEQMSDLARELTAKNKMSASDVLRFLQYKGRRYELNFKNVEGNSTMAAFYAGCVDIVSASGHGEYKPEKMSFDDIQMLVKNVFSGLGFKTDFLDFRSDLPKEEYEKQDSFRLWHLLYSYSGDSSATGDDSLIEKISEICGMPKEYAQIISRITFADDYASLSHKAMRKILPYLKGGNTYDVACSYAGYNHSHSQTKEEIENKVLKERLDILPKGTLRNPVVEKIINQMVHVVNQASDTFGKPDEIHIELARELKQNQKERQRATEDIAARTKENEECAKILREEFGLAFVSQNDIIRYRLYKELEQNGYRTLYSDKYIERQDLFSKKIDIEHIIPQARLFNDSFSNKTLEFRDINIEKGKETARDYILGKYGQDYYDNYALKVDDLYHRGAISKAKRNNLLMCGSDIPEDFINRELTDSQYIAKKAREILEEYVKVVMPTTGSVTAKLREDWQLVDVMKELNLPKYRTAGLTYFEEHTDGKTVEKISDWTKRNDHRHHAMDAITIAFTRPSHIQILNNLNASSDMDSTFYAIKKKEMQKSGVFNPPIPLHMFRAEVKDALESTLVSIKAKNKVVTRNINKSKGPGCQNIQTTLTPRGSLHKEQVYGKRLLYETTLVPVGSRLTAEVIETVAKPAERNALRARLQEYGGDAKKAFTGKNAIEKNPIFIDEMHTIPVPAKVKCVQFKTVYSIRKAIGPDLKLDKVADVKVKALLQARLDEFDGKPAKAFSDLENNPIWLNKEKGIRLKSVTIFENFDLTPIHSKCNKDGKPILDAYGKPIENDYVNLRNNHHAAIYRDANGKLQERVIPFYEALLRITGGAPAVDKFYKADKGWSFLFSIKVNEMFVFPDPETGFNPSEIDLCDPGNNILISKNLFRVQKLSPGIYYFRHHQETLLDDNLNLKDKTWKRVCSLSDLENAVKVRINHIGQIVAVGEYD